MNSEKTVFNWSSGKDSALALSRLLDNDAYEVSLLLTTLSETYRRVSQHGVREELLELQAERLGIPLKKVWLPQNLSMGQYDTIIQTALLDISESGVQMAAFGDIFLEDLRRYREKRLSELDFKTLFPIWQTDTADLAEQFISSGFRAKVVCVNTCFLERSFAGRDFDRDFLNDLPEEVDSCGENGEFHTFVYDGPLFNKAIPVKSGAIVYRSVQHAHADHSEESDSGSATFRCGSGREGRSASGLWFCELELC